MNKFKKICIITGILICSFGTINVHAIDAIDTVPEGHCIACDPDDFRPTFRPLRGGLCEYTTCGSPGCGRGCLLTQKKATLQAPCPESCQDGTICKDRNDDVGWCCLEPYTCGDRVGTCKSPDGDDEDDERQPPRPTAEKVEVLVAPPIK